MIDTNKKPVLVVLAIVIALAVGYYFGNQKQTHSSDPVRYSSAASTALAQASIPTSAARAKEPKSTATPKPASKTLQYVYNKNTHKFHYPWCSSVDDMSERNKVAWYDSRAALLLKYPSAVPCKRCDP